MFLLPSIVVFADMGFVAGSFFFLPKYYHDAGLYLFIIASTVLMIPELWVLHRFYIRKATVNAGSRVWSCFANVLGLLSFIVGSVLFHPGLCNQVQEFSDGGVHFFVVGSIFFLVDRLCKFHALLSSSDM